MIPTDFDESNGIIDKPADMSRDECVPLSVLRTETTDNFPVIISCWKLTKEELEEINRTGRIWVTVVGHSMPAIALDGVSPIIKG